MQTQGFEAFHDSDSERYNDYRNCGSRNKCDEEMMIERRFQWFRGCSSVVVRGLEQDVEYGFSCFW